MNFSLCENSNPNAWMADKMWGHSQVQNDVDEALIEGGRLDARNVASTLDSHHLRPSRGGRPPSIGASEVVRVFLHGDVVLGALNFA
ncbi:MAG TPA: hypothetical protein VF881_07705 [Polyangiaceae bacterium]